MTILSRTRKLGAAALISAVPVFGFGSASVAAEGQLILYTSSPDADVEIMVSAFREAHPEIEVRWTRLVSATLFNRFVGEAEAGVVQADVLYSGSSALYQQRPELFESLNAENVPNIGEGPKVASALDSYLVASVSPHYITYNTDLVSQEDLDAHLASWEDLADPVWQGAVALLDPSATTNYMSWYKIMRAAYGDEWLERLGDNDPVFIDSGSTATQQTAAGAFSLTGPITASQSAEIRRHGAPVAVMQPDGPAHAVEFALALAKDGPNPDAAFAFANWIISSEGQATICELGLVPVMPDPAQGCLELSPNHVGSIDVIADNEQQEILRLLGRQ